jgi:raffinose/stachyose/melibiose transport system permease protein
MTTVFSEGLVKNNFGYASSMAVLVIIVLIGIAAAQNKLNNKLAEGGNG